MTPAATSTDPDDTSSPTLGMRLQEALENDLADVLLEGGAASPRALARRLLSGRLKPILDVLTEPDATGFAGQKDLEEARSEVRRLNDVVMDGQLTASEAALNARDLAETNVLDLSRMYGEVCGQLLKVHWLIASSVNEDHMVARLIVEAGDERRAAYDRAVAAETALAAANAEAVKLAARVDAVLTDACRISSILLMAGEMTAQERRTALAVAKGLRAKVLREFPGFPGNDDTNSQNSAVRSKTPARHQVKGPHMFGFKVLEGSDTLDGRNALTMEWEDGRETVEIVSQRVGDILRGLDDLSSAAPSAETDPYRLAVMLASALRPFAKAGELFEPRDPRLSDQAVYSPAAGPEYGLCGDHLRVARAALDNVPAAITRMLEAEQERSARYDRLLVAFHDAVRRPLGVTPDSGAEFYDPRMADAAEERRPRSTW